MSHHWSGSVAGAAPAHLRTDGLVHRWDVDADQPTRLTWRVPGADQVAYQVSVRTSDGVSVWDSGQILSSVPAADLPAGTLSKAERYRWRVRAWPTSDTASPWSDSTELGTGPGRRWRHSLPVWSSPAAPQAGWSDYDMTVRLTQRTPRAPGAEWAFFRDERTLDRPIRWASLFVTASSPEPGRQFVYRVFVNGTEVGQGPTRSMGNETRYDGFDVTELLRPGPNTVAAQAWTPRDQRFQAELVLTFTDGEQLVWGTSGAWAALSDPGIYPAVGSIGTGYYAAPAEYLQLARFPVGFTEPGFDDSQWGRAVERESFAELLPTPTAKVVLHAYEAVKARRLGPDTVVLDFGRTHVGGVRIRGVLPRDCDVELRYAELLDDDGRARFQLATGNVYLDRWSLPAGEVDAATWGLRVFRYLEVRGIPAGVVASLVSARGHVYPLGELGSFVCSDPRLDEIVELCRQTMVSTNLNLLVDSWSREREPYEADAYLQMRCNGVVGDDVALARYALEYLLRRRTWPTEWPFYLVLMAWELYLHSGDDTPLREHYDALRRLLPTRWLDPATGLVRKEPGSDGSSSKTDHDIVDWPPAERDDYRFGPVNTVVNAVAYGAFRAMANIASSLDRVADAAELNEIARRLAAGMNDRLWDEQAGAYCDGLDADGNQLDHHAVHASAFAAAQGVAEPAQLSAIGAQIARRGMVTSVYAAPFVLEALYAAGRADDAYDLIVGDGLRSWRSMIRAGAGATMEAWSESLKANISCAHPWSASPLFIVAEQLMGVRPTSAGYRTFEVRPMPGPLRTARLRLPTVAGMIGVMLHRDSGAWQLELDIPAGTSARLVLPPDARWTVTDLAGTPIPPAHLADLDAGTHVLIARPDLTA